MNPNAALIIAPVVLPMMAAAVLLLIRDSRRLRGSLVNIFASCAGLAAAVAILWHVNHATGPDAVAVHLTSNWAAPFGIALVADRLSALMLVVVGIVGVGTSLYAAAGWSRTGSYFHPLFQILLMGINGAFLTGDLFNLFVFFEVMLAASYGLQLHGSGWPRVRSGMHYIAINLLASSLFLIGLAILYGVMGTLSMADVAAKVPLVPLSDRGLLHAGAAILAMAFLIKAAVWPLNAWLVPAYTAASTPVAALFVLMTKVGVYAVLRLWMLLFPAVDGASTQFGGPLLLAAGLATLAFGAIGVLASIRLDRIAAFSVIVTSGTLMASFATGSIAAAAAALFYLISSTFAVSALFLMVEPVQRTRSERHAQRPVYDAMPDEDDNLDDEQLPLVGRAFPVSVAALGLAFMACSLLVAGLPPLSGFLSKAAILTAIVGDQAHPASSSTWILMTLLLCSSLFTTISLVRAGIRHFWASGGRFAPRLKVVESGAVLVLLGACVALTVFADPVLRYTTATATYLHAPRPYVDAVFGTPPRPGPTKPEYPQVETP
ncbi:monovalent cation/H+ antiporter subunit D [Lysobacter soli]|uniref:Monovalent cation/H+ antiporter subunit D n=1 Tax=Lysobacter soli TaxID=453783 RepID=A0A3D8VD89_9GAMM|nr:monovalent cation/H+ antiporter subunit D [Lysobacter soli]RDY67363.1 monovalent cation/H+ antiporter subunit D [Lysobacter soli]